MKRILTRHKMLVIINYPNMNNERSRKEKYQKKKKKKKKNVAEKVVIKCSLI